MCDEGYDGDAFVEVIDRELYRERNLAGQFRARAKQYRRVATRCDKKAQNFPEFVHPAPIMILLK